ncbi:MAG: dethiobiotin synthase [Verrucomicrobia bacterium]|nr:dethiobiotin synthase [Verrucomicrobiota bacterium]
MAVEPSRGGARILFVTGTDTGVGKTLLTALLLVHLRERGICARAMKPVSSGGREDAKLFFELLERRVPLDEINPFYFDEPVAPLLAAKRSGRITELGDVLGAIRSERSQCDYLLVEGAGGLLSPLGKDFSAAELIRELGCSVLVVGKNQLGVINHVRLTLAVLQIVGATMVKVVLDGCEEADHSTAANVELLRNLLHSEDVFTVPFLGHRAAQVQCAKKNSRKLQKILARILD